MNIDHYVGALTLRNYKCFSTLELNLNPALTIFFAKNAGGKSAILRALAISLSPFVSELSRQQLGLDSADPRQKLTSSAPVTMEPQFPLIIQVGIALGEKSCSSEIVVASRNAVPSGGHPLREKARVTAQRLRAGSTELLPLFAFYGTGRFRVSSTQDVPNEKIDKSRTTGYSNCLQASASFLECSDWLKYATYADLQERHRNSLTNGQTAYSRLLEEVSRAVQSCVEDSTGWTDFRYDIARESVVLSHDVYGVLELSQLSDGIRGMVALVADLAYRCVRLNALAECPNGIVASTPGIVLIDEVDLHLHPAWQQVVVASLTRAFPRMQFVLTTHSPQVLASVGPEFIRELVSESDGTVRAITPEYSLGATSSQVLEGLMHVESRPPQLDIVRSLARYRFLVEAGEASSEEGREIWAELMLWGGSWEPELRRLEIQKRMAEASRRS